MYIWVPLPAGSQFELEEGRTVTAIPGAGVLGGFNPVSFPDFVVDCLILKLTHFKFFSDS
jgi:hypothetical protein